MPQFLKDLNRREFFNPSSIGIFTNPYFFIKRGIYQGIKKNARYMGNVMLDFGCGSKPYRHLFEVEKYIGLDIKGNDSYDSQIDVLYDGERMPFANNTFDSVLAAEVFEHVYDIDKVLDELYRIMKLNAYIIITVPFLWEEHDIPYDYIRFTSYGIKKLLEGHGFQVVKYEKVPRAVETCFQLWNAYFAQKILSRDNYSSAILLIMFISPITILGLILGRLLPNSGSLFLSNIVVAQKVALTNYMTDSASL